VKALSLRQPWAWAILCAGKRIENRRWPWLKHGFLNDETSGIRRNERIALHASATKPKDYDWAGVEHAIGRPLTEDEQDTIDVQRGHVIGMACVRDVLRTDLEMTIVEDAAFPHYVLRPDDYKRFVGAYGTEQHARGLDQIKRWWLGPYAFQLADEVSAIATPIPAKGALGFWTVTDAMRDRMMADVCSTATP
jgi:hypothetical protein